MAEDVLLSLPHAPGQLPVNSLASGLKLRAENDLGILLAGFILRPRRKGV